MNSISTVLPISLPVALVPVDRTPLILTGDSRQQFDPRRRATSRSLAVDLHRCRRSGAVGQLAWKKSPLMAVVLMHFDRADAATSVSSYASSPLPSVVVRVMRSSSGTTTPRVVAADSGNRLSDTSLAESTTLRVAATIADASTTTASHDATTSAASIDSSASAPRRVSFRF